VREDGGPWDPPEESRSPQGRGGYRSNSLQLNPIHYEADTPSAMDTR
jgi:hypothetical protein